MKYQFIAGTYHGIVEAESEEETLEKLRAKADGRWGDDSIYRVKL